MPAARTTLPQREISLRIIAPNSAGDITTGSALVVSPADIELMDALGFTIAGTGGLAIARTVAGQTNADKTTVAPFSGVGISYAAASETERVPKRFPMEESANNGQISPDGKWLAYQSEVSGNQEVYVRPFPDSGPRVQVSSAGSFSGPVVFTLPAVGRVLHNVSEPAIYPAGV
mgnify:CR=1 FL=1